MAASAAHSTASAALRSPRLASPLSVTLAASRCLPHSMARRYLASTAPLAPISVARHSCAACSPRLAASAARCSCAACCLLFLRPVASAAQLIAHQAACRQRRQHFYILHRCPGLNPPSGQEGLRPMLSLPSGQEGLRQDLTHPQSLSLPPLPTPPLSTLPSSTVPLPPPWLMLPILPSLMLSSPILST